jgi:hypothetical protein
MSVSACLDTFTLKGFALNVMLNVVAVQINQFVVHVFDGYLLVGESCEISLYNLTIDIDQQINKIIIRLYSKVIIII